MRYSVAYPWHSHEAVFYIGVALTLFSLALLLLRKLSSERVVAALSLITGLAFVVSVLHMSQISNPKQTDIINEAAIADFEIIRSMTDDGNLIQTVALPQEWKWFRMIAYYLSGRIVITGHETAPAARPLDFVVSSLPLDGLASLTPQNQTAFLYEWNDYHRHIDEIIEQTDEPLTRHGFDVHLVGNALIYAKDACRADDVTEKFFLTLYPVHESDLPDVSRPYGSDNLAFHFEERAIRRGERCIAIAPLPEYDVAHIYTGQYIQRTDGSTAHSWAGWLIDGKMRHIDEIIEQAGEPLIRSKFDVYQDGSTLLYLKDACGEDEVSEKFFLALYPAYESDLPADRRQRGYDAVDFRFQDRGVRLGKRCIAIAPLPEYAIDHIHTGQYIDRADGSFEHTWEWIGKIHRELSPAAWADLDEIIAQSDKPLIRSHFDVYLSGNNLIYVKDSCSADDTEPWFFLAVYPADETVLSDDRRQHGFDNFDFPFHDQAVRRNDQCVAITALPDYDIDRIYTGQYIQRTDGSFEHLWEGDVRLTEIAR